MKPEALQKDKDIEQAIIMLVKWVNKGCSNPKPVILHSIRVAMKAQELGLSSPSILACYLHDLVEDTACSKQDIDEEFGSVVSNLVLSLTQEHIEDYKERWSILLRKIIKAGREAMVIKLIDNNDNAEHVLPLVKDKKDREIVIWKANFTFNSLREYIGENPFFKECENNFKRVYANNGF